MVYYIKTSAKITYGKTTYVLSELRNNLDDCASC